MCPSFQSSPWRHSKGLETELRVDFTISLSRISPTENDTVVRKRARSRGRLGRSLDSISLRVSSYRLSRLLARVSQDTRLFNTYFSVIYSSLEPLYHWQRSNWRNSSIVHQLRRSTSNSFNFFDNYHSRCRRIVFPRHSVLNGQSSRTFHRADT